MRKAFEEPVIEVEIFRISDVITEDIWSEKTSEDF